MTTHADARRPRKDTVHNRARLLSAARETFRSAGLDVPIEEVARHAGVGTTTFYRHFPTKDDLLAALLDDLAQGAGDVAARCLEEPDPWEGFARAFQQGCVLSSEDLALFDAVGRASAELGERARAATAATIGELVRRAQAAGAMRDDVSVDDVAAYMRMLDSASTPDIRTRYADVLLRGLRASNR
jgi:AcrR family transcriptional regulator